MFKRWGYILILLLGAAIVYWAGPHLSKAHLTVLVGSIIMISFSFKLLMVRRIMKKMDKTTISPVQKVSNVMLVASLVAVMCGLLLLIMHVKNGGRLIVDGGLLCYMAGVIIGMFAPAGRIPAAQQGLISSRSSIIFRNIIYLCTMLAVMGLLLKINHYAEGWYLVYAGMAGVFINIFGVVAYLKYARNKLPQQKI